MTPIIRFLLLFLLIFTSSWSRVDRIAIVVGSNRGLTNDEPLQFAEADAQEMARVFSGDQVHLLVGKDASQVTTLISKIKKDILARKQAHPQDEFLLVFHYSGHGDSTSLHINGHIVSRNVLLGLIKDLPVEVRVVVIDACESGGFLRSKAGRSFPTVSAASQPAFGSKGMVVLASSSRSQLSHESAAHGGGIFTHHLIRGLKGAADQNGDGDITLTEAYAYARRATLLDPFLAGHVRQDPGFDMDLVGHSDIVLYTLSKKQSPLRLVGLKGAGLDIFRLSDAKWMGRFELPALDTVNLFLPIDQYLVRTDLHKARVDLRRKGGNTLRFQDLSPHPQQVVRNRGSVPYWSRSALAFGGIVQNSPSGSERGVLLTKSITRNSGTRQIALSATQGHFENGDWKVDTWHTELSTSHHQPIYRKNWIACQIGYEIGIGGAFQRFEDTRKTKFPEIQEQFPVFSAWSPTLRAAPSLAWNFPMGRFWGLGLTTSIGPQALWRADQLSWHISGKWGAFLQLDLP